MIKRLLFIILLCIYFLIAFPAIVFEFIIIGPLYWLITGKRWVELVNKETKKYSVLFCYYPIDLLAEKFKINFI